MSEHFIPIEISGCVAASSATVLGGRVTADESGRTDGLRTTGSEDDGDTLITFTYTPDLTAEEIDTLQDVARACNYNMSYDTFVSRKADVDGLKAYLGVGSPTANQTALAMKALIRVVAAINKDD